MIIAFVPPAISCDSSSRPDSPASRECDPVKKEKISIRYNIIIYSECCTRYNNGYIATLISNY